MSMSLDSAFCVRTELSNMTVDNSRSVVEGCVFVTSIVCLALLA